MPLINTYQLPKNAEITSDLKDQYVIGSFSEALRNFHIRRLPYYSVSGRKLYLCPYCGKWKDRTSMQVDHIIPFRPYIRYKLFGKFANSTANESTADDQIRKLYSDHNNLVLCCSKCNASSQDRLITPSDTLKARKHISAATSDTTKPYAELLATFNHIDNILAEFATLRGKKVGRLDLYAFVHTGKITDGKEIVSLRHRIPRRKGGYDNRNPYDSNPTEKMLTIIENSLTIITYPNRPPFDRHQLAAVEEKHPTKIETGEKSLYLCFYCMGLFNKQAFQIDHIAPSSGRIETKDSYNTPSNLIPVCRTCNAGKGDRRLTLNWLDAQISKRQNAGLRGIEHATDLDVPTGSDPLTYAKGFRNTLLRI